MIPNTLLFLDIETAPNCMVPTIEEKGGPWDGEFFLTSEGHLFAKKYQKEIDQREQDYTSEVCRLWKEKASLHAEFSRIVCISMGRPQGDKFFIKNIIGKDEKKILEQFAETLAKGMVTLCAHNGIEFDFPFLMRRFVINGLPVPHILNTYNKKPWELPFEDTMKMWSCSAWNYKCSLELIAHALGIESPKQDLSGGDISELWYSPCPPDKLPFDHEKEVFDKIAKYCNGDVLACAQVYSRLRNEPLFTPDQIQHV